RQSPLPLNCVCAACVNLLIAFCQAYLERQQSHPPHCPDAVRGSTPNVSTAPGHDRQPPASAAEWSEKAGSRQLSSGYPVHRVHPARSASAYAVPPDAPPVVCLAYQQDETDSPGRSEHRPPVHPPASWPFGRPSTCRQRPAPLWPAVAPRRTVHAIFATADPADQVVACALLHAARPCS